MSIFDEFEAQVDIALVIALHITSDITSPQDSAPKNPLSAEMTLLLALVMYDGYELFPGGKTGTPELTDDEPSNLTLS